MPDELTVKMLLPDAVTSTVPAAGEYNPLFVSLENVSDGVAAVPAPSASAFGDR
jgi:hypothetical protein